MASTLARCVNGHIFNTKRYGSICPYCEAESEQTYFIMDKKTGKSACPLQSVKIEADVDTQMAMVLLKQDFKNTNLSDIEAVYIFPLPHKAEVTELIAKIGDVEIVGEIKEKEEAYKEYDLAVKNGDSAFLLDQARPDIFQIWLGNIAPGESITIELTYTEETHVTDGELRWLLPTVVAPRYIPGNAAGEKTGVGTAQPTDRVPDADNITPPIGYAPYTLDIKANFKGIDGIKNVSSPSHPVDIEFSEDCYTVKLARDNEPLDSDFILVARMENSNTDSLITASDLDGETFSHTNVFVDLSNRQVSENNYDYYFVIDTSGSMAGEKLEQAKRALHISLRNLMAGDTFNLIAFQSSFSCFSNESVPYSQTNLEKADSWIDRLRASGGTEILEPLKFLVDKAHESERIVLLFTDGEVGNEREIHNLIRSNNNRLSLFPFGIDTAVNKYFIDGLADAGNAIPEYVYPGERIEDKVIRQFARIHQPYIINARFTDINGNEVEVLPKVPKRLYDSEAYGFVLKTLKNTRIDSLTLTGEIENTRYEHILKASGKGDTRLLSYRWAREKIKDLETRLNHGNSRRDKMIREEIIEISKKYGVLSTLTSFVAVYNRTVKEKGIVETVVIPVNEPKMWGMYQSMDLGTRGMRCCAPAKISDTAPAMLCFDEPDESFSLKRSKSRFMKRFKQSMSGSVDIEEHNTLAPDRPHSIDDIIRHVAEKQNADGTYGSGNEIIRKTSAFIIGMLLTKENWKPYKIQIVKASKALMNKTQNADLLKVIALCLAYRKALISSSLDEAENKLSKTEAAIIEATMQEDLKPLSVYLGFDFEEIDNDDKRNNLIEFVLSMV